MGFEELTTPASRLLRFGLTSAAKPVSEENKNYLETAGEMFCCLFARRRGAFRDFHPTETNASQPVSAGKKQELSGNGWRDVLLFVCS